MPCPLSHSRSRRPLSLLLLACVIIAQPVTNRAQQTAEAEIRAATEGFFRAYQKKDIEELVALWSIKSPEQASLKQQLQKNFATPGNPELKTFAIGRIVIEGDRATVRATVETAAVDSGSDKSAGGNGTLNRTLQLVRESGAWKVWKYGSSEEQLAAEIAQAPTTTARKALLGANRDPLNLEFDRPLLAETTTFYWRSNNSQ